MFHAMVLTDGARWQPVDDLDKISDLVAGNDALVWAYAGVATLTASDITMIRDEFGLDKLAVEDAIEHRRQRPKFESYANHFFAVVHQLDEIDGQLEARQLACFIGPRWVLTVHDGTDRTIDEAGRRMKHGQKEDDQGSSFIMHNIIDAVVDDYQAIADRLENEMEQLEEDALADPHARLQSRLYSVKQQLSRLRRYVAPGDRVLSDLQSSRFAIGGRTAQRFRDVHDHTQRVLDQIRNVDELADAVIELQRAEQTHALNEVTKRLTGWAAIIAVPTLIASVYGMNFELLPNEQTLGGFYFAVGTMIATGLGLFAYFKRRGWI